MTNPTMKIRVVLCLQSARQSELTNFFTPEIFLLKPLCFLLILKTLLIKSQPWSSSPKPNPWGGF